MLYRPLYIALFLGAASSAVAAEWEIGFTAVTLASGTVPLLSFWAEHRATRRVRALQRSDAAAAAR